VTKNNSIWGKGKNGEDLCITSDMLDSWQKHVDQINLEKTMINTGTITIPSNNTIDLSNITIDASSSNNMYYTNSDGTISTITLSPPSASNTSSTYTIDTERYWDTHSDFFRQMREFEDIMPSLTKVEEMCSMYPSLDKAFENFKAIYNLVKDDYEARKNNDT